MLVVSEAMERQYELAKRNRFEEELNRELQERERCASRRAFEGDPEIRSG